jgi:hypothetical protein
MNASLITVEGVVKVAREYAERAQRARLNDPYATPPSFSEAGARMLCSRKKAAILKEMPADSSDEQKAAAALKAPAAARLELDFRWAQWEGKVRREREEEQHRDKRHARRQKQAARDRSAARAGQSLGQRLDKALAEVCTVSGMRASTLEAPVTGLKEAAVPTADDPAQKVRAIARDAVNRVEDELESLRRRRVELEDKAA